MKARSIPVIVTGLVSLSLCFGAFAAGSISSMWSEGDHGVINLVPGNQSTSTGLMCNYKVYVTDLGGTTIGSTLAFSSAVNQFSVDARGIQFTVCPNCLFNKKYYLYTIGDRCTDNNNNPVKKFTSNIPGVFKEIKNVGIMSFQLKQPFTLKQSESGAVSIQIKPYKVGEIIYYIDQAKK